MATLKLSSSNEGFSFIIKKNPASGMVAKNVRKGTAFGWYPREGEYCIAFFDGMDEMSFAKNQNDQFSYVDATRYNSPLFLAAAIKEFLHSALNSVEEQDTAGFTNTLEVTSIEIGRVEIFKKIIPCFEGFDIEIKEIPAAVAYEGYDNYNLKITTQKSVYELLNLGYLLSHLIAICSHVDFTVEKSMLTRLIEACNLLDAPYYVRHLIRCWCIFSTEEFKRVKDLLNTSTTHKINICPNINMITRLEWIKSQIARDTDVVDFGCGDGKFFSISKKISTSTYYAIERDDEVRESATRYMEKKEFDNIIILDDIESFFQAETDKDFVVIMSEVFEHNELDYMDKILKKFMEN